MLGRFFRLIGGHLMNRAERRRKERDIPIKGWLEHPSPKQLKQGDGWFGELDRVYRRNDNQVVCMMRDLQTEWGMVTHVTVTAHNQPKWMEKQQIKNDLFGEESHAIEVFPKVSQLVNESSMYHLWILHEIDLPFGLHLGS